MPGIQPAALSGYPSAKASRVPQEPEVILYSDLDDSLVGDAGEQGLAESRQIISRHDLETLNGYATGRGILTSEVLADKLTGFPMEFFAPNNGQTLFLNHEGLPADEFLRSLSTREEDPVWAAEVQRISGGWSVNSVRSAIAEQLTAEGFVPGPPLPPPHDSFTTYVNRVDGLPVQVAVSADQPAFYVMAPADGELTEGHVRFGTGLRERLSTALHERGVDHTGGEFTKGSRAIHFFQPVGVTKASLLEHLTTRFPSARYTITVGDNVNDDMLEPERFGQAENLPVLAGDHHPRQEQIEQHPRLEKTGSGAVGPGIDAQYQRIAILE